MILTSLGVRSWLRGCIESELKPKSGPGPKLSSYLEAASGTQLQTNLLTPFGSHPFLWQAAPGLPSPLGTVGLQGCLRLTSTFSPKVPVINLSAE